MAWFTLWDGIISMVSCRERRLPSIRQPAVSEVTRGTDKLTLAAMFRTRLTGAPIQARVASPTVAVRISLLRQPIQRRDVIALSRAAFSYRITLANRRRPILLTSIAITATTCGRG